MDLILLVLKIESGTLVVIPVQDVAGIGFIPGFTTWIINERLVSDDIGSAVVGILGGSVLAPRIAVVGRCVETVPERLSVDQSSGE